MSVLDEIQDELAKAAGKNLKPKYIYIGSNDYNLLVVALRNLTGTANPNTKMVLGLEVIEVSRKHWLKIGD